MWFQYDARDSVIQRAYKYRQMVDLWKGHPPLEAVEALILSARPPIELDPVSYTHLTLPTI